MAVATGTALLIAAGISAGTQIYGNYKKSKAEEDALNQGAQAADDVGALAASAYAPYTGYGGAAMTTLGQLSGLTPQASGGLQGPAIPAEKPVIGRARGDNPVTGYAVPRQPDVRERGGGWGHIGDLASVGAANRTRSGFSRVQGPDGSEDDVPDELVPLFEQEGFRRMA